MEKVSRAVPQVKVSPFEPTMTSVQHLRDFIRDRLAAAADDIFSAFERTIVQYEEELEDQRRLREITCSPTVKRHGTDLLEEVLAAPQLCKQENPEPPQVKEEQQELCSRQEGEPPVLKQEADAVMVTLTPRDSNHSDLEPDGDSSDTVMVVDFTSKAILEVKNERVQDGVDIGHQRRVLDHTWNPVVKLYRTDFPQQHVCNQQEDLTDQQLCNQENLQSRGEPPKQENPEPPKQENPEPPKQENPEPPQVKEEQEELCSRQKGEPPVLKQEADVVQPCLGPPAPVEPITAPVNVSALSADSHLTLKTITFTGELPYVCNTCGKGFKEKVRLRMHMRVHTGERPHVCSTCGERFRAKADLRKHMKIHTNEQPHLCDTCGKTFIEKSALQAHRRTHTGERPYVCNTCGKRYKKITTLKLHMEKTRCSPKTSARKFTPKRRVWVKE